MANLLRPRGWRNRHALPSWMMHRGVQVLGIGWGHPHRPSFREIRPYVLFILHDGREVLLDRRYRPIAERGLTGPAHIVGKQRYENIAVERFLSDPPSLSHGGPPSPAAKRWLAEVLDAFFDGRCIREFLAPKPVNIHRPPHVPAPSIAPPENVVPLPPRPRGPFTVTLH